MTYLNVNPDTCNFCRRFIPQHEPRFHCMSCVDYNLCASCRRNAQFSGGHTEDHIYQLIQTGVSASNGFPPVGGSAVLQYTGPPNPFWDRVITENRTASDRFRRLIDSIHNFISWTREPRSGNLEPEKASHIMALLEYPDHDNIFHLFLTHSTQHPHGLAWSDYQTLRIYQTCGWGYQEGPRDHNRQITSVLPQYQESLTSAEQFMPLLTRAGFRDMIVTEALADPVVFRERFNILLYRINGSQRVLRDLEDGRLFPAGPIESNCWPLSPDAEAVETRARMQRTARAAIEFTNMHETMNAPVRTDWRPYGSL
ncbi:hypothetical protein C7212DRAFT_362340 [Tuber magnatum]|uniref:ZZ-type domain-containing protein n=1 Tax=Tuber magnatum TaxID=42249 RepID=A0A317SSJ6_9PEZI|nr:hypothetical protein C7212DRAFT_362340 [Tuber magnatum]